MAYRNDGVDLRRHGDGSLHVADMQAGEWLAYSIDVDAAGRYDLVLEGGDGRIAAALDGREVGTLAANGILPALELREGRRVLRLRAESSGFDLARIRFVRAAR